jgi:hypothetical protein
MRCVYQTVALSALKENVNAKRTYFGMVTSAVWIYDFYKDRFYFATLFYLVIKKALGAACKPSDLCDETVGLKCVSSVCGCPLTHYWSNSKCGKNFYLNKKIRL